MLKKFLVTSRVAPILFFSWIEHPILPDNAAVVIALESHFHFGVLQSAVHEYWAWARGSTLKGDLRYTNTTIFETFPFPLTDSRDPFAGDQPDSSAGVTPAASVGAEQRSARGGAGKKGDGPSVARPLQGEDAAAGKDGGRDARPTGLLERYDPRAVPDTPQAKRVSKVAEQLYAKRQAACLALNLGLTKLYNLIKNKRGKKDPQDADFDVISSLKVDDQQRIRELRALHEELNNAVCACYGWPEDTWRDENEVLSRLLRLNLALTE
ncbi:MAG TPA: hypothetical protein ENO21_03330 [Firmicutes bacterium]|nr:hypothetical protein [Bacillota bacterium]